MCQVVITTETNLFYVTATENGIKKVWVINMQMQEDLESLPLFLKCMGFCIQLIGLKCMEWDGFFGTIRTLVQIVHSRIMQKIKRN